MVAAAETRQATGQRGRRRHGRRRSNPLDYSRKTWMRLTMGGAFFFLYFPIVSLIAFSFRQSMFDQNKINSLIHLALLHAILSFQLEALVFFPSSAWRKQHGMMTISLL